MKKLEQLYTGTLISFQKTDAFQTGGKRESLLSLIRGRLRLIKGPLAVMLVFSALCVGLNMAMIWQNKTILDGYMGQRDPAKSSSGYTLLGIYVILMILYTLSGMLRTRVINQTSRKCSARSGSVLFKTIFRQPMRFFEQYSPWLQQRRSACARPCQH